MSSGKPSSVTPTTEHRDEGIPAGPSPSVVLTKPSRAVAGAQHERGLRPGPTVREVTAVEVAHREDAEAERARRGPEAARTVRAR